MHITDDIRYAGVNDHQIDLFEGLYAVPNGMSYNSYVILDERVAVLDTVDQRFGAQWLENIRSILAGRMPDYLVVHHMEPDHSANITAFMRAYPRAVIVASAKAFSMMQAFFGDDFPQRRIILAQGSTLPLGAHTLTFIAAPMVHWPEVILSYDSRDHVLFSADAFGKFGALDTEEADWSHEARRYYFGIVGKYGTQVQALLKKTEALDIRVVCPLHGPALRENLTHAFRLYHIWSSYAAESQGVVIAYTSIYGNTQKAVALLEEKLKACGCQAVVVHDLARCDMAKAVEDAFRYDRIVLATTTYNAGVFPFMREFIQRLSERGFQKRTVGLIENGAWAPAAAKVMRSMLDSCRELTFTDVSVSITAGLSSESRAQIEALACELCSK